MRVFHLEANPADLERVRCELLRTQPDAQWVPLVSRTAFLAALDEELPALVLADRTLPDLDAVLGAMRKPRSYAPQAFMHAGAGRDFSLIEQLAEAAGHHHQLTGTACE